MPYKPNTPCKHLGCPKLVPSGERYCVDHKELHKDEIRSAASRGYDRRWQKARLLFLKANPLCVKCMEAGVYTKATVVDHIVPHRGDQKLFWDKNNWQALCKKCHDKKTGREDMVKTYSFS